MGGLKNPPMHPDDFDTMIAAKAFTNGSDAEIVSGMYRKHFYKQMEDVEQLDLGNISHGKWAGWCAQDIKYLSKALPCFKNVTWLILTNHPLGDAGVIELATGLEKMPQLKDIELTGCVFTEVGLKVLVPILLSMEEIMLPKHLQLTSTGRDFTDRWLSKGHDPTLLEW